MSSIESAIGFARENPRLLAGAMTTVVMAGLYANAAPVQPESDCTDSTQQVVQYSNAIDPLKISRSLAAEGVRFDDLPGPSLQGGFFDQMADSLATMRGYTISPLELQKDNPTLRADDLNADGDTICLQLPAPVLAGEELTNADETLASIADDYSTTVDALRTLNAEYAQTDIDEPLAEGSRVRISQDIDRNYVLQPAKANLNQTASTIGTSVIDLVSRNYAVFANGGTIQEGDQAYIPMQQSEGLTELGLTPDTILTAYESEGAYAMPVLPEPAPVESPAPNSELVSTELSEAQIQIIDAIPNRTPEQIQFIKDIYGGALALQAQGYTINAGAFTAQIICESNWGQSGLTVQDNNFAGLKAPVGTPDERIAYWPTQEFINGQYVTVNAAFLHADTQLQGLQDVADFWRKPWYDEQGVNAHMIPEEGQDYRSIAIMVFEGLHDGGWATSPTYVGTLTSIFDANHLDQVEAARATPSSPAA